MPRRVLLLQFSSAVSAKYSKHAYHIFFLPETGKKKSASVTRTTTFLPAIALFEMLTAKSSDGPDISLYYTYMIILYPVWVEKSTS